MGVRTSVIAGKTDSAEDFRLSSMGLWVPTSQINARTGVTTVPVLTGTGSFTCTVGPFSCVIDGTSNSLQGSYWAALDTAATVTINAANTQARIDLISLQIQDNAYDGSGVNAGRILYTAGTPGSGVAPTAPANSISLWTVPVAANASSVNFSSATAVFPFTAAAGGVVPVRSANDKPAVVNGAQYRHRLDVTATTTGPSPLESSVDGVTWVPVSSGDSAYGPWTNAVVNSPTFTVLVQPQYRTIPGNRVELRGQVSATGSIAAGTSVIGSLPVPSDMRMLNPAVEASSTIQGLALLLGPGAGGNTNTCYLYGSGSINSPRVGFDGITYSL